MLQAAKQQLEEHADDLIEQGKQMAAEHMEQFGDQAGKYMSDQIDEGSKQASSYMSKAFKKRGSGSLAGRIAGSVRRSGMSAAQYNDQQRFNQAGMQRAKKRQSRVSVGGYSINDLLAAARKRKK